MKAILKAGSDVKQVDRYGMSVMQHALYNPKITAKELELLVYWNCELSEEDFRKHLRREPQRDITEWILKTKKWDFKQNCPPMEEVVNGRHYTI